MRVRLKKPKILFDSILAVNLLLVLGLFFFARDLVSIIFLKPEKKTLEARQEGIKTPLRRSFQDWSTIVGKNPFGLPGGKLNLLSPSNSPGAEVSVSRPDLRLLGTVVGPFPQSYAIFSDHTGNQEVFLVGDLVHGSGRLKRIERDRTYLVQNGKEIEIRLFELATSRVVETLPRKEVPSPRLARESGSSHQMVLSEAIGSPECVLGDGRLSPNFVDGRIQGFGLDEVAPGGLYQKLGLQKGDILFRINEKDLSSFESVLLAFFNQSKWGIMEMDVIRGGAKMKVRCAI